MRSLTALMASLPTSRFGRAAADGHYTPEPEWRSRDGKSFSLYRRASRGLAKSDAISSMRMSVEAAAPTSPLRRHLLLLVVAGIVPVLVYATIMVVIFGRGERWSTERGLRGTTRALTLAVDREIETSIKALETLAASLHLDTDDYNMFERHAGRVLLTQPGWRAVILTDARGAVILRTSRVGVVGARASLADRPYLRGMTQRLRPALSDVLLDRTTGEPTIAIVVPVVRGGRLRHGLGVDLEPDALSRFLAAQNLPPDWTGTIMDREGFVVARSRIPQAWL